MDKVKDFVIHRISDSSGQLYPIAQCIDPSIYQRCVFWLLRELTGLGSILDALMGRLPTYGNHVGIVDVVRGALPNTICVNTIDIYHSYAW